MSFPAAPRLRPLAPDTQPRSRGRLRAGRPGTLGAAARDRRFLRFPSPGSKGSGPLTVSIAETRATQAFPVKAPFPGARGHPVPRVPPPFEGRAINHLLPFYITLRHLICMGLENCPRAVEYSD